jgi:hypothetical protein
MAAAGSNGLSPGRDQVGQVPGMNWLMPSAPAGLTASGCQPDSCSICAAMTEGAAAAQRAPACRTRATYCAGTVPALRPWPSPPMAALAGPLAPAVNTVATTTGSTTTSTAAVVTGPALRISGSPLLGRGGDARPPLLLT